MYNAIIPFSQKIHPGTVLDLYEILNYWSKGMGKIDGKNSVGVRGTNRLSGINSKN